MRKFSVQLVAGKETLKESFFYADPDQIASICTIFNAVLPTVPGPLQVLIFDAAVEDVAPCSVVEKSQQPEAQG